MILNHKAYQPKFKEEAADLACNDKNEKNDRLFNNNDKIFTVQVDKMHRVSALADNPFRLYTSKDVEPLFILCCEEDEDALTPSALVTPEPLLVGSLAQSAPGQLSHAPLGMVHSESASKQ